MSGLARQLLGATGVLTTVTGSVFGSGSLEIPAGVVLVTLTGRGGKGGDNSYYNPGQPYVSPSGYHAEVTGYQTWGAPYTAAGGVTGPDSPNLNAYAVPYANPGPSGTGTTVIGGVFVVASIWQAFEGGFYVLYGQAYYTTLLSTVATVPAYYDIPGQPYIAPTSGGGVYSGSNTTATLNSVTDTWIGGYGGAATSSVQTLASTGAGQTMTYSIASGGTLNFSYSY